MAIGKIGIWMNQQVGTEVVPEIEALGYGALWLGGSPSVQEARAFVEASTTLTIASGVLNIWKEDPTDQAAAAAEVRAAFPGRYLMGIGVGHPEFAPAYQTPLAATEAFLDGLDAAPLPVPKDERILAALGPKMLDLAKERTLGTHPYFAPAASTRAARERLGDGPLVAVSVAVVVEPDEDEGRRLARGYAEIYLGLKNYTNNLLRHGFEEADLADGGSDRLIDAVIPHGAPEAIAEAVQAHLDAGADHVCVQPVGHPTPAVDDLRALAKVLL